MQEKRRLIKQYPNLDQNLNILQHAEEPLDLGNPWSE